MRRNRGTATYGRHRSRVIVTDVWSSEERKRNVFSTSSELDSSKQSSIFHSSGSEDGSLSIHSDSSGVFMSSKTRKANNRLNEKNGKKTDNKENVSPQTTGTRKQARKTQVKKLPASYNITESSIDSSAALDNSCKPKALRERKKNIDYNDIANLNKQLKGTAAKRKRAVKTSTLAIPKNMSLNFSDFDDYSLVISDSSVNKINKDKDAIETSTPVAKRTRHKHDAFEDMKDSNLSHIEIIESPTSDVCYSVTDTPNSSGVPDNMASPSLVSSVANSAYQTKERSNMYISDNLKYTPENAIVRLEKMSDSFIQSHSSGKQNHQSVYNTRNSGREVIDLSASLFSTPASKKKNSVHLLTEMMKNISFRKQQNMTIESEENESNDLSEEEEDQSGSEEEEECSDDDDDESDKDNGQNLDLSDIEEVEDESETESEESSSYEASDMCNSNSEDSEERDVSGRLSLDDCNGIDKKAVVNLQRLSESLISNHVSSRGLRRRKRGKRHSVELNEEDEKSVDSFSARTSDSSNCSLYMLADSNCRSSISSYSSQNLSDNSNGRSCVNDTNSITESDYHTAETSPASEGDAQNDEASDEELTDTQNLKTPRKITLRNRTVESLQNSFSEMLTPKRRSKSLIPLSAQTKVLLLCEQSQPISFSEALPGRMLSLCKKIGEGVYGEVFRSSHDNQSVAIKIIPIEGDFPVNDEPQKKYSEILPEIVIAKELSNLREDNAESTSSFCKVISVSLVHGKYPVQLIKQWDIFHKEKNSENDRPDMFQESQLYVVFEFADCGRDLESYQFESMDQAKSVLTQVTFALAVAEHSVQFEHRDLHWGNILIRPTAEEELCFKLMGKQFRIPTMGVEANVIDFTLSRLQKDGVTVFSDLSTDDSLFQGEGDIQFQVYRDMKEENGNNWEPFHPFTNVLWLHYVADKLVYHKKYPSQSSRQGREILRQFRQFLSGILEYESACELAIGASFLNS